MFSRHAYLKRLVASQIELFVGALVVPCEEILVRRLSESYLEVFFVDVSVYFPIRGGGGGGISTHSSACCNIYCLKSFHTNRDIENLKKGQAAET